MTELTLNDIRNYLIKIQVNFENAYKFDGNEEFKLLLASWHDILKKYPKEVCDAAVNNSLSKAKFAPRIGDIVEEITILLSPEQKSDEELWAELMDVKYEVYDISRDLRYPHRYDDANFKLQKIYGGLSEELKLYIVNLSTLIEISALTAEELPYEKSRFFRNMPALRKNAKNKVTAEEFLKLTDMTANNLLEIENIKK